MVDETIIDYPRQVTEVNFNLLDSHDTTRILSIANGDKNKVRLAYLFMLSQTGSPCIYYGDEIGLHSGLDGEHKSNRGCMVWEEEKQDRELFSFIKRLLELRKENPEFKSLSLEWFENNAETNVIAFRKGDITFLVNNSEAAQVVSLPGHLVNREAEELFEAKRVKLEDKINLKPYSFVILK
jgi:neopullulanase